MRLRPQRSRYVQAAGQMFAWLVAQGKGMDVAITDPEVWVNQVQGPTSLAVLDAACGGGRPDPFGYFGIAEVGVGGQRVVVTRAGFSTEMGWEYYNDTRNRMRRVVGAFDGGGGRTFRDGA